MFLEQLKRLKFLTINKRIKEGFSMIKISFFETLNILEKEYKSIYDDLLSIPNPNIINANIEKLNLLNKIKLELIKLNYTI